MTTVGRAFGVEKGCGERCATEEAQRTAGRFQKSKQFTNRPAVLTSDITLDQKLPPVTLRAKITNQRPQNGVWPVRF